MAAGPEPRELQRHRPALGSFEHRRHAGGIKFVAEQPADVVEPEAQILLVEFDQIALRAQPRHRKGGPAAHRGHQLQPLRAVAEQPFDHLIILPRLRQMIIVEENESRGAIRRQRIEQGRERFRVRSIGITDGVGDGIGEIGDEAFRIAVVLVEREPGDGLSISLHMIVELREQGGLAETGGRMQQREQGGAALVELRDQRAARHRIGVEHGGAELAEQQGSVPSNAQIAELADRLPPIGEGRIAVATAL